MSGFPLSRASWVLLSPEIFAAQRNTQSRSAQEHAHYDVPAETSRCSNRRMPLTDGATPSSSPGGYPPDSKNSPSAFLSPDVPLSKNYTCWRLAPNCLLQNKQIVFVIVNIFFIRHIAFLFHEFCFLFFSIYISKNGNWYLWVKAKR